MSDQDKVRDVLEALKPLFTESRTIVVEKQDGVPTFFNVILRTVIEKLNSVPPDALWRSVIDPYFHSLIEALCSTAIRRRQGRLIGWMERVSDLPVKRDIDDRVLSFSQGVLDCVHWKGMPVFKTAYEFSIYSMMVWELKPATIIELGSGKGGSALWFADLLSQYRNSAHVYSIDISRPDLVYNGVTFIEQDIFRIEEWMQSFSLHPRPWLVIEDAHVNIPGVLKCMHNLLESDDYLVIEDSSGKQRDIDEFMKIHGNSYKVDTRYTDYFGLNVTSALNSVFKKIS